MYEAAACCCTSFNRFASTAASGAASDTLVSALFYWFKQDLIAYSVLAAAVLIDLVIYRRLRDLTVCYRCHAEFRGSYRRTAGAFDLHTADVLEPEWERKIGRR